MIVLNRGDVLSIAEVDYTVNEKYLLLNNDTMEISMIAKGLEKAGFRHYISIIDAYGSVSRVQVDLINGKVF